MDKVAKWEPERVSYGGYEETEMRCSNCHQSLWYDPLYKYCPECGARIDGGENE